MRKQLLWLAGVSLSLLPSLSFATDTYYYLRCNATSWNVDDQSLLQPVSPGFVRELSFDVKEQWMVDGGDDCVITETPVRNAWGNWQHYYGGQLSFLRVPESSQLRLQASAEDNVYFKLKFPALGRYRFALNTRDGYFSVRKDAQPQAGDVAWTLPGNMQSDAFNHLFLASYYPKNSLSLVDPGSVLPRWTYAADHYISFYSACSTADTAFITLTGRVAAVSVATGKEIWGTDLGGALKDAYGYLTCYPGNDQVFLSYGNERTTLVSLSKADGRALWSWTAPAYAGITGTDAKRIFINTYQDNNTALRALDKLSGRQLWQAQPGNGYYSFAEDGSVYFINGSQVSAVAADSGRTLWTYQGEAGDAIWVSFETGRLFLHEKTRISLLNKTNGRAVWMYDFSRFVDQYPYAQVLKPGVVLIRVNNYEANTSKQIALNAASGKQLWEQDQASTNGYLTEDNARGTWLINGKSISAIEPWSGQVLWSYTLDSDRPMENIMNVMENAAGKVYVAYGVTGSKYPPMGVVALDVGSGRQIWKNWMESSVYRVASTDQLLILNAGYYGSTKAVKK